MTKLLIDKAVVEQALSYQRSLVQVIINLKPSDTKRSIQRILDNGFAITNKLIAAIAQAEQPVVVPQGFVLMCRECERLEGHHSVGCSMLSASPSPAPAVPDAAKPEMQGERAELIQAIKTLAIAQKVKGNLTSEDVLVRAAALLAAGPAHVEPLTEAVLNSLREKHGITSTGRGIREWSQIVRFAREIEAYHGIGKDQAS